MCVCVNNNSTIYIKFTIYKHIVITAKRIEYQIGSLSIISELILSVYVLCITLFLDENKCTQLIDLQLYLTFRKVIIKKTK